MTDPLRMNIIVFLVAAFVVVVVATVPKWFEPRSISSLYCVIIWVRVYYF